MSYRSYSNVRHPLLCWCFLVKKCQPKRANWVLTSESLASTSAPPGSMRNLAMFTLFSRARMYRLVRQSASCVLTSAPCSSRTLTTSWWPWSAANLQSSTLFYQVRIWAWWRLFFNSYKRSLPPKTQTRDKRMGDIVNQQRSVNNI